MKPEGLNPARADDDLIDFPELVRTFGRYKWGVLSIALLVVAGAALVAFSLPETYRATVTVLIEPRSQRVVQVKDVYDPGYGSDEFFTTQWKILESRDIAEKVVDRLKLLDRRQLLVTPAREPSDLDLRQWLPFLPPKEPAPVGDEAKALERETLIDDFVKLRTIEPVLRTQLVKIHFDAFSPEVAAEIANAIADVYIESQLQARLDTTRKATEWLTAKLADIRQQLEISEKALQAFRDQEQIVNVGGARTLTEEELADYARRQREAQKRRTELQTAYEKVRQAGNDPRRLREISALLIDPLVSKANSSLLDAQEAVKQLEERYGSKHPQMAAAKARLDSAQGAMDLQLRVAAAGVKTEYEIALASERALNSQVQGTRSQIQRLDRKEYEFGQLQREVDSNRELFNTFLTRFKETDTAGSFEAISARVVDPAVTPREVFKPDKKKILLLALVGGLLFGILLALLRHLLSEEVRSAEELETLTRLPVFGVLPLVSKGLGRRKSLARLYLEKPKTPFAEGVRSIRAALQLSDVDKRFKRIMVTSSVPKEGKSCVSSSLAVAFGSIENVLLVDADLRMPSLHRLMELPDKARGLVDVLTGKATLDECLLKHEPSGIWVLPAGTPPPNPGELLSSEPFARLVHELSARFDRIVFDSPPCQAASDALLLAKYVNAVLFVVKSDSTSRRAVKNSLKQLQYAQAPLVGNVVNQVDVSRNPSYLDGYYYAYGYYG
ncbi:MAG TPA: polysaccharide biosynthesis tyrosine autokinase [Solimonas sp.]|nr:polysaccharide biosynthesis tyrosine autokinase [Solimonas sp.]